MSDTGCQTAATELQAGDGGFLRWTFPPLIIFLASRLAIMGMGVFSLQMDGHLNAEQQKVSDHRLVQSLTRWDGGWFIQIATHGYRESRDTNFFPLFPLLGHVVHKLSGLSVPVALLLCANLASLAAYVVVYRIFLELDGPSTANAALCLIAAWPFSFFHASAYPESLMMIYTAAAMLMAHRNRPAAAGIWLGFGMLARHLSALAGLSLLFSVVANRTRPRRFGMPNGAWIGLVMAAAFPCAYFAYLQFKFGDWAVWLHARESWGGYAWWGLRELFTRGIYHPPEMYVYAVLSLLPATGAFLLLNQPRWRFLAPFAIGLIAVLWLAGIAGLGRYCASCWPAFLPLGHYLARRPTLLASTIAAMALMQGVMFHLFVHLYPIM